MVDDIQPPVNLGPSSDERLKEAKSELPSRDRISRERIAQVKKATSAPKAPSAVKGAAASSARGGITKQMGTAGNVARAVKSGSATEVAKEAGAQAAKVAVTAAGGGPIAGKAAEIVTREALGFFKEHKGLTAGFLLAMLLGPFAIVVQLPLAMFAAIIYLSDHA